MQTRFRRLHAFSVLLMLGCAFDTAWARQEPEQPENTEDRLEAAQEPEAAAPAEAPPQAPAPVPPRIPASPPPPEPTPGYTRPLTPGYAAPLPPPPPAPRSDAARRDDAHVDRVILVPTAETHPEGAFTVSSYEVVALQFGYAVSDTTQVAVTGTPPLGEDGIFPLDISVKTVVLREPLLRAAAIGSASGLVGFEEGNVFVGRAGAVVQMCFTERCDSSLSYGATLLLAGPALLSATGVGAIWRVSSVVSLLAEAEALIPLGEVGTEINGFALSPGIRFSGSHWGVDLSLIAPIEAEDVPAIPFLAGTYRFLP